MATFAGAADAVGAAVAVQQAIDRHNRSDEGERIEVRIGLSVGDVTVEADGDCFGLPVVEAQRLEAASTPGQILCASMVRGMARGRGGHEFRMIGSLDLKGLAEPLDVDEVVWEPVADEVDRRPGLPPLLATPNAFGLAGREAELTRLTEAWKRSCEGPGHLVLLSGEPGIGKTRLVAELAATVVCSGGIVLAGRSDEDLTAPYGPVVDALGWWTTATGPGVDLGEWPGELVRLLPDLAILVPALADAVRPGDSPDATLLNQSIRSWLEATARVAPVLLVLDDLHWADAATLVLVRSLFDRSPPERLLVVGTYRDTDLDRTHPLAGVLADLRRHEHVTRLAVAGLDEQGVVEFMSLAAAYELDEPGRALAHAVWEETSGNPFFVGEVLRHLAESGAIVERDGAWTSDLDPADVGIPEGIREVVGRRLTRLGPDVERILSTAAVVGLEFGVDLVGDVLGDDADAVLDGLEEAGRAALVDEVTADRWRFAHAIVRETLLSELSSTRRVRQHRKVATALETAHAHDLDAVVNQLAHHWGEAAAGGADVTIAMGWAVRAGDLAVTKAAMADAARWFEQALGLVDPDEPEDTATCALLVELARVQAQLGEEAYRTTMLRAADLARDLDDHALLTAALVITPHTGYSQNTELARPELIDRLEFALEEVGPDEPGLRAQLLAALALELQFVGEPERRDDLCDEAYDFAVRSDEAEALEAALRATFYSRPQLQRVGERVPGHREATLALLERSLAAGDDDLAMMCTSMAWWNALYLGDRAEADAIQERARELAGRRPTPLALRMVASHDAMSAVVDGDLDRAASCLSVWTELGESASTTEGTAVVLFTLALERGFVEAAIPAVEEALLTVPQQAFVRAMLAVALVETGREDRANELFDWFVADGHSEMPDDTVFGPTFGMWLEVGWALRRTDRLEEMEAWLGMVAGHPVLLTGVMYLGSTDRFRGLVARLAEDDDAAEEYFRTAVTYGESVGAVPMTAAARSDWAELCLDRGDPDRAASLARATLEAIGDLPLARQRGRAQAVLDRVAAD